MENTETKTKVYVEPPTGWVQIPIARGVFEVSCLLDLCDSLGGYLIGGYARYCCSQAKEVFPAGDADIFPVGDTLEASQKVYEAWKSKLIEIGLRIKHENEVSITWDASGVGPYCFCPTIQLIKPVVKGKIVTSGTLETILGNFDFSVVRVAINRDRKTATAWASFTEDESKHFLRILNIHCPISSTLRFMKYSRKGYWSTPREVLKMFQDWISRTPEYRAEIEDMFTTSAKRELTREEIDHLEALLHVD